MKTFLPVDGYSILASKGMNNALQHGADQISKYTLQHGINGPIRQTDAGHVIAETVEWGRTVRSLTCFAVNDAAKNAIWGEFQKGIAAAAQEQASIVANSSNAQFISNLNRAPHNAVVYGSQLTGFYADLYHGENAIAADLLKASKKSPEARLNFGNLDFHDADQMNQYMERVKKYSEQVKFGDTFGFHQGDHLSRAQLESLTGDQELLILMHTRDSKAYSDYIEHFESAIQKNFAQELQNMQSNVQAMGFTGNVHSIKDLEKFAATQAFANKYQVEQLILATQGKINKVDRYLLARINSGEIDIHKALAEGKLNGVQLTAQAQAALKALNVYANTDAVTSQYHNAILERLGSDEKCPDVDLSKRYKVDPDKKFSEKRFHIDDRVKVFENALGKAGLTSINGKKLSDMKLEDLRKIDFSKVDAKYHEALKSYVALREHQHTIKHAFKLKSAFGWNVVRVVRKALGDSDLAQSINQLHSHWRTGQLALKVWMKTGAPLCRKFGITKLIKFMGRSALKAYKVGISFIKKSVLGKAHQLWGNATNVVKKTVAKVAPKTTTAATKAARATSNTVNAWRTRRTAKHATRAARRAQRSLMRKVGNPLSKLTRVVSGIGKKIASSALGKLLAKIAAKLAALASKALLACVWVLLIILIIATACQLLSALFYIIADSAASFNESLAGQILNFFTEWTWPWEADEEDKRNVFLANIRQLQEEEKKMTDIHNQINSGNYSYGLKPNASEDGKKVKFESYGIIKVDDIPESKREFIFTNPNGDPVTQFSTVKTVLSMAHAYTHPIEYKEDLSTFTLYATGLWRHMNKIKPTVTLTFCKNDSNSFTYDCRETKHSFYKNVVSNGAYEIVSPDSKKTIETNNTSKLWVTSGEVIASPNENGCRRDFYYIKTHEEMTQINGVDGKRTSLNGEGASCQWNGRCQGTHFLTTVSSTFNSHYTNNCACWGDCTKTWRSVQTYSDHPYADEGKYLFNPEICHDCAEYGDYNFGGSFNNLKEGWEGNFCSREEVQNGTCKNWTNYTWKYNYITYTTEYCASGTLTLHDGINHEAYVPDQWKIIQHTVPMCDHSASVTYYECTGHSDGTNHGKFTANSPYMSQCGHYEAIYKYVWDGPIPSKVFSHHVWVTDYEEKTQKYCQGYQQKHINQGTETTKVCLGHMRCIVELKGASKTDQHYYCPGHTITYCKGHPQYKVTNTIMSNDDDARFSDDWTIEVTSQFLWIKDTTEYTPKTRSSTPNGQTSLAKEDWIGWVDKNGENPKDVAYYVYIKDWYTEYNVSMKDFVGGTCTSGERAAILERLNVDDLELLANHPQNYEQLNFAFDAIGNVPYYQNSRPEHPGYDDNEFFSEHPNGPYYNAYREQIVYNGIGFEYFAGWVWRSMNPKDSEPRYLFNPAENRSGWNTKVTTKTPAGTLIACFDNKTPRTGVLVSAYYDSNNKFCVEYIGMDNHGWCTMLKQSGDWYYHQ